MPVIRRWEAKDAAACRAILEAVLPAYGLKVDFEKTDRDLTDVEGTYLAKGGMFWVVEDAGRVVGMGGVEKKSPEVGEVRKMYFLPELRGKGFGRKLLDEIQAFARASGIKTLTLETASVLKEAIALYEKYGFRPDVSLLKTKRCDTAYRLELM